MLRSEEIVEMLVNLFESGQAADGDFCGEQREWHLPRLSKAMILAMEIFPKESYEALGKTKSPYDKEQATK